MSGIARRPLITLTANRNPKPNLFGRILEEPYSHRHRILTSAGAIKRLIPTKELGIIDQVLWADITFLTIFKEVILREAAREESTSIHVGISCQCKMAVQYQEV